MWSSLHNSYNQYWELFFCPLSTTSNINNIVLEEWLLAWWPDTIFYFDWGSSFEKMTNNTCCWTPALTRTLNTLEIDGAVKKALSTTNSDFSQKISFKSRRLLSQIKRNIFFLPLLRVSPSFVIAYLMTCSCISTLQPMTEIVLSSERRQRQSFFFQ